MNLQDIKIPVVVIDGYQYSIECCTFYEDVVVVRDDWFEETFNRADVSIEYRTPIIVARTKEQQDTLIERRKDFSIEFSKKWYDSQEKIESVKFPEAKFIKVYNEAHGIEEREDSEYNSEGYTFIQELQEKYEKELEETGSIVNNFELEVYGFETQRLIDRILTQEKKRIQRKQYMIALNEAYEKAGLSL